MLGAKESFVDECHFLNTNCPSCRVSCIDDTMDDYVYSVHVSETQSVCVYVREK